jgi:hypothetical protein
MFRESSNRRTLDPESLAVRKIGLASRDGGDVRNWQHAPPAWSVAQRLNGLNVLNDQIYFERLNR